MNILSALAFTVMAAETVISPLPDTGPFLAEQTKPAVSFGQLTVSAPEVLGAADATSSANVSQELTHTARKSSVTIALVGDSMTDTLGPDGGGLATILKKTYPDTVFTVKNFGVGGTNILYGLTRLTSPYTYLGTDHPAVVSVHPDIVVIESFAYNPLSDDANPLDTQWLTLARMTDTVRQHLPDAKIVIAATIAPDAAVFGDGAPGIHFSSADKYERTRTIASYLENAVRFAGSQHLPLADAYHPSMDGSGNGKLVYINGGDHIHYSDEGRALMAKTIADAITNAHVLE